MIFKAIPKKSQLKNQKIFDAMMKIGGKAPAVLGCDENGVIERIITPKEIKVGAHAEQILTAIG